MPRLALSALLLLGIAGDLGCVLVPPPPPVAVVPAPETHGGPPAHAPAWGYRSKHPQRADDDGLSLRFDPALGVDVVVGYPDVYFANGVFLRFTSGAWQASVRMAGPWRIREEAAIPPGLRARYHGDPPGHERKRERNDGEKRGAAHPDW
jgi:hypothetical protein